MMPNQTGIVLMMHGVLSILFLYYAIPTTHAVVMLCGGA